MLHDVIISVQFSISYKNHKKKQIKILFSIFSPEGNFDIDAGDGGGGPFRTPQISPNLQISQKNNSYENCSHFWDIFPKHVQ